MAYPAIKTCKSIDLGENFLIELDAFIKETNLTLGPLSQIKQILLSNSNMISENFRSTLSQFSLEPTFPHPELVHWAVSNYVPSTKQVISYDGSRIIVSINSQIVRKALCLPPPRAEIVQFTEEKTLAIIKALSPDQLYTFMSKMFKLDISPSNHAFPYDSSLFSVPLQAIFSILSQILGLKDDRKVAEIMVGIVCLVNQFAKEINLSFDQYLVEKIAYQLGHFQSDGKMFNYQKLLMLMIIRKNLNELRQMEPIHFLDSTDLSQRNATMFFFTFAISVIPALYKLIFDSTMPRIGVDLKSLLHGPVESVGDWFCFADYTLIRVYGFEGEPFRLPKFTNRRLFSLEFLRQRLISENDNFIKHKKASSLKFVFILEPFVVKTFFAANITDQILSSMRFDTDKALRYDPKGVMHQRRIEMNLKGYDAEQDEVLAALANTNLLEQIECGNGSSNNQNQNTQDQQPIKQAQIPTPFKVEKSLKRPSADTMEVGENTSVKKPRLAEVGEEIVEIEDDDDRSINKGKTTIVEEESQGQSQSVSNTEKTISNPAIAESSQMSAMVLQKYISS